MLSSTKYMVAVVVLMIAVLIGGPTMLLVSIDEQHQDMQSLYWDLVDVQSVLHLDWIDAQEYQPWSLSYGPIVMVVFVVAIILFVLFNRQYGREQDMIARMAERGYRWNTWDRTFRKYSVEQSVYGRKETLVDTVSIRDAL